MTAIDRLCTIATDVSLEATTLAADVRDELAHMRSAIGKALPLLKRSDEECEGGDWCSVHDDFMHAHDRCFTGEGIDLLLQALPISPSVEREAPAPELTADGGSGAGGPHLFVPEGLRAPGWLPRCRCGASAEARVEWPDAVAWHEAHIVSLAP